MKTKKPFDAKILTPEKMELVKTKPRSLRPMRSMVAVRSLKSKTMVASLSLKIQDSAEKV
jgi:hypothetical protein